MKLTKKTWISLGSIVSMAAPIAAVISCGAKATDEDTLNNLNKLKSAESMRRVEEQWQKMVLHDQDHKFVGDTEDNFFTYVKSEIIDNLKRGLTTDSRYLWNIAQKLMETDAMKKEASSAQGGAKTTFALANDWNLLQVASKGKIDWNTKAPTDDALKMLFKEDKSFRSQIIKTKIIKGYLKKGLTPGQYSDILLDKDGDYLNDIQDLIKDDKNFLITNEVIKQHLFLQFDYSLNSEQSQKFLSTTLPIRPYNTMLTSLKNNGDIKNALNTFSVQEKIVNDDLVIGNHTGLIAYSGTKALVGTKGILKKNKDELKKATDKAMWKGFVVDGELIFNPTGTGATVPDIPLFPEENGVVSKTVKVKYVEGIMPIYSTAALTMEGTDWFNHSDPTDELLNLLSQSTSLYDEAKKYYTKRKKTTNTDAPVLLEITSPDLKNIALKNGFDFIKE